MEVNIYKGKKNDLVIGLVKRWTLTDENKTITISMSVVGSVYSIKQWGMDMNGDNIGSLELYKDKFTKKFLAVKYANSLVAKFIPGFPKKSEKKYR